MESRHIPSDPAASFSGTLRRDGKEGRITADIDLVLAAIEDARRAAEEAIVRLRAQGVEKMIVDAVSYTQDELAAAKKRLVQRTMYIAA